MLRPMANLFAVSDSDPSRLDRMEEVLRAVGDFSVVWRPCAGWVAAQAPLPESEPDSAELRARGFAFVEGRDRLERGNDLEWLARVAEITDRAPGRLAELPGDFGFVRFRADGSALVVRACGGLAPFYVHRGATGVAIGTLLNYFTRFLPDRFELDPLINVAFPITGMLIDGRTFLKGVSILPRGSHTNLRLGHALETGVYWDPQPVRGQNPRPSPEHARTLRSLLINALERDLDPAGRNLLTLSGGVDSSSIGALAAGVVGRQLSSFSLVPGFEPERSHELAYIRPIVDRYGIEPADLCEVTPRTRVRWATDFPGLPFQVAHPALCELPAICASREIRVLFGGEFADEVCGDHSRMDDWALNTTLLTLIRPGGRPFGPRDFLRWGKRRLLHAVGRPKSPFIDMFKGIDPAIVAEYRDWLRRLRVRTASERRPLSELASRAAADGWVAMNWEGTTPLGVRRSIPFFTREVLELAFSCHPRELLGPGPKRLLREALRDDVPAQNLFRPDKGVGGDRERGLTFELDDRLIALAEPVLHPRWRAKPPARAPYYIVANLLRVARVAQYLQERTPAA